MNDLDAPAAEAPLSLWEIQARLIYSILVAGKTATFAENALLRLVGSAELPFTTLRSLIQDNALDHALRSARTGNYSKLLKCLPAITHLDPVTCSIQDLEACHGIGPKTARFFLLWTRPDARYAALDTHVLKWLRTLGHTAPKSTPPAGPRYRQLEAIFLAEADKRNLSPRQLDLAVWDHYANGTPLPEEV